MNRCSSTLGAVLRSGCGIALLGLMLCLGVCGCKSWDFGGPKYEHDPMLELPRDFRTSEPANEFWGISNKARQIESNLGVSN